MAENDRQLDEKGMAHGPGVSWDELAAADSRQVPAFLLEDTYRELGSAPLSTDRYTSPEFFQREMDKMWPHVWQFAARDEELRNSGDVVVYENAGRSYLVTRQPDGSVKAFHNVCLHRGRKLRTANGSVGEFKCSYHAWTWNTDGSLKNIPSRWDFKHLDEQPLGLPEAEVGRWGGFIFIREEPGGPSLEEFLGPLPAHFERWKPEQRVTTAWAAKVVPANWKACAEAFMEAFHVIATHPQIMPFTGDANSKYNLYNDNVNLAITPFGVTSPHLAGNELDQQEVMDAFLKYNGRVVPKDTTITVPDGLSARKVMGDFNRKRFAEMAGVDLDHASDAEVQDALTYNVFPNMSPWGGFSPSVLYRWRPWPDQDHTLMEVRILTPVPVGQPMPAAVSMQMLDADAPWASALGVLGGIVDQDMGNLPHVQTGMKVSKNKQLHLGNYQEVRIRHFHQTLDKYLAD
ncbi:aromatic ring-hydroxylating oxygenase subunit alpha [Noviherbaspirillum sedimenti]|uniref:Aromatic ring-hydroxylating dioxygenase subunit alpha n=1 Tax=Noviherbaspirillum sedimenti TaxID=2320865 RepID=A0A3A3G4G0_9BURK|nr:aromatic ring-hydroxylating dioxygenase subunit alpha [Noviherbaspirillum sedimenti]RJG03368.1 aromatic ring-hydroxylating dioxygenase subunit alpha [Noviherbaspirillum sedimenti]